MTTQIVSLHGLVVGYERAVGFYIELYPECVIVIGSEVIWTMEGYSGPGQQVFSNEAQKYHDQAGHMPL